MSWLMICTTFKIYEDQGWDEKQATAQGTTLRRQGFMDTVLYKNK